jgi:DNA helicase HerA-like ATPase
VDAAAESFRPNPRLDTGQAILELGVGEALVSTLGADGVPGIVERTLIRPPASRLGPVTAAERAEVVAQSPVAGVYDQAIDRESAYERLSGRPSGETPTGRIPSSPWGGGRDSARPAPLPPPKPARRGREPESLVTSLAKTVLRGVGNQIAREVVRGIFGSLRRR